jgi:hypothetical protein
VETEFIHVDGQTNMTKLVVDLRNFAKTAKESLYDFPLSELEAQIWVSLSVMRGT